MFSRIKNLWSFFTYSASPSDAIPVQIEQKPVQSEAKPVFRHSLTVAAETDSTLREHEKIQKLENTYTLSDSNMTFISKLENDNRFTESDESEVLMEEFENVGPTLKL